jgi:16S rRNA (guanine527-N7)-methyltransferase
MASGAAIATVAPYAAFIDNPDETAAGLDVFLALLTRWQKAQNLVSRETLPSFWQRHAADSLQLLRFIAPDDRVFVDLGSGGGLPAIPLALALRKRADATFTLVESNQRKASFLRAAGRELGLSLNIEVRRADEIDSRETLLPDIVTSRALAPLPALCVLSAPLFGPDTRALFHKGREHVEELAESRAQWQFDVLVLPSDTSDDGAILEIRNLRSRSAA